MTSSRRFRAWFSLALLGAAGHAPAALEYNRDIRPILADACFNCHGADANVRKADLRLDIAEGAYAERKGGRVAVAPGQPERSELVRRIFTTDAADVMPPPKHPFKLTSAQKELIRQWIQEGAAYQGHWAYEPLRRPALPVTRQSGWQRNEIDAFVLARLEAAKLPPAPEAARATLIRRLSLDLTGLPPTPDEVAAFVADPSPDAYAGLVDRLLASQRFGERMAMSWLDGARYADSHGYQADWERYQWPWRDWVINAYNRNLPFDQFTVEQLAGDLLPAATRDQIVATGFNRNHRINTEGGSIAAEWLVENVIDRVETMGSVWLGLSLGCARCHDHKYDPISQKEFYQLFAFFHNVPEGGTGPGRQGNFDPVLRLPSAQDEARLAELRRAVADADAAVKSEEGKLPERLARWEQQARAERSTDEPVWRAFGETAAKSEGGATLTRQPDGSFLASGTNPATDDYEITLTATVGRVTALLLEALPDSSMKNKSLGRASNGNFVLSEFTAEALADGADAPVRLEFSRAEASYEQANWPVKNTLDGRDDTGWAVDGNTKFEARQALFELAAPLELETTTRLLVRLRSAAKYGQHAIGRFRLQWTDRSQPSLDGGPKLAPALLAALSAPAGERTKAQQNALLKHVREHEAPELAAAKQAQDKARKALEDFEQAIPTVMVLRELDQPRDTFFLNRGQYDQPGERVSAALPAAFPPMAEGAPANRLGLARWIVAPENPLTARVQVNRLWEMLFGAGIVASSENFGTQAEWPSHPELLDWLASELIRLKWDTKAMLKTIVLSAAYRQDSAVTPDKLARDPENRLLSRGPRFRVQAETVRDQALFIAGLLNERLGGPSVRPYQPAGIWSEFNFYGNLRNYTHNTDAGLYRRSLYTIWKRTAAPPGMTLFDMPNREICTVKRPRTNTPLQALALMNDVTFVEASRAFAQRLLTRGGRTSAEQIAFGFRCALARTPSQAELATLLDGHQRRLAAFAAEPGSARQLIEQGESKPDANLDPVHLAAMTTTASVLLNLDETITRE